MCKGELNDIYNYQTFKFFYIRRMEGNNVSFPNQERQQHAQTHDNYRQCHMIEDIN